MTTRVGWLAVLVTAFGIYGLYLLFFLFGVNIVEWLIRL